MAEKVKVDSSFIKTVSYEPEQKELVITFKGRPVSEVAYFGVSGKTFRKLVEAESVGTFFNSKIKGKYSEEVIA